MNQIQWWTFWIPNETTSVVEYQQSDNIIALFCVADVSNVWLLFIDAFDELTDKIAQFSSNVCLSYSILHLLCKFHSFIPKDCQNFATNGILI